VVRCGPARGSTLRRTRVIRGRLTRSRVACCTDQRRRSNRPPPPRTGGVLIPREGHRALFPAHPAPRPHTDPRPRGHRVDAPRAGGSAHPRPRRRPHEPDHRVRRVLGGMACLSFGDSRASVAEVGQPSGRVPPRHESSPPARPPTPAPQAGQTTLAEKLSVFATRHRAQFQRICEDGGLESMKRRRIYLQFQRIRPGHRSQSGCDMNAVTY